MDITKIKRRVIRKGYTVEVHSWENDADYRRIERITVSRKEEALALKKVCDTLFKPYHDSELGIGNMADSHDPALRIDTFMLKYPEECKVLTINTAQPVYEFQEMNVCVAGTSDYYWFRVCDRCDIFYSDKDIYLPLVTPS